MLIALLFVDHTFNYMEKQPHLMFRELNEPNYLDFFMFQMSHSKKLIQTSPLKKLSIVQMLHT